MFQETVPKDKIWHSWQELAGTLAITNCEANIASAHIQSTIDQRGENIFEVNVTNLDHLQKVMNSLMKIKGVIKVERIKH